MIKINFLFFIFLFLFSLSISAENSWITKKESLDKDEICSKELSTEMLNTKSDFFIDIEDYDNAFKCSIYAANQKDTYAEATVGWLYNNGYGVEKNYKKAIEYLNKAKNGGSDYARNLLAENYANGWGVNENLGKALGLYTKSANNGDDYAQAELGYYYYFGKGTEVNKQLAYYWFEKAADQGNSYAQGRVGYMLYKGDHVEQNLEEASRFIKLAADKGDTFSEANYGYMLLNGDGVETNYEEAFRYSKLAADKGDDYAQANIGYHYEYGEGVEKDITKAIKYYELAAKQENEYALERLDFIRKEDLDNVEENDYVSSEVTSSYITKKKDKKIDTIIDNNQKDIGQITMSQSEYIPIEEFMIINAKTKLKENYNSDSKTISILKKDTEVYAKKELKDSNVLGNWVKIEVKINKEEFEGFVLKKHLSSITNDNIVNDTIIDQKKYDIDWGDHYALVIGNNDYDESFSGWSPLKTAINDANKIGEVLKDKYGFKVEILKNATRNDFYIKLNEYSNILTENDNLLIYYAGHGDVDPNTKQGYWVPIGAPKNQRFNWVKNENFIDATKGIRAKHIIIIADACFSGSLFKNVEYRGIGNDSENLDREGIFYKMNRKKTRVAITSGEVELVPDYIGDESDHSPFASVLIDILNDNNDVLPAGDLFTKIRDSLQIISKRQSPVYGEFDLSKHEQNGDFLFVPSIFK